jgi:hypothetical protein
MWKCARIAFPASAVFAFGLSFANSFRTPDPLRWWHVWTYGCFGTVVFFVSLLLGCASGVIVPESFRQMLRHMWDNDNTGS